MASSSFAFDFEDEDSAEGIESDDANGGIRQPAGLANLPTARDGHDPLFRDLPDLLPSIPTHFAYSSIEINPPGCSSYTFHRRELFDIRRQLMMEDEETRTEQLQDHLVVDDIRPQIYEGGFKTWECAIDLSNYVRHDQFWRKAPSNGSYHVLELGAGTALPSLSFLKGWQSRRKDEAKTGDDLDSLYLDFADFNESVLELSTLPNLFLSQLCNLKSEGDIEISDVESDAFMQALHAQNVHASFISGRWSDELAEMIIARNIDYQACRMIILASETVYSPESIPAFTAVLVMIMNHVKECGGSMTVLVATKRLYFGVGGGYNEFCRSFTSHGGKVRVVWDSGTHGVNRLIVECSI